MKKKLFEGSLFTVGASLWWGIIGVIYFKFVSFASPVELTIHRTIWTTVLLVFTTFYFGKWSEFKKVSKSLNTLGLLFFTGVLFGYFVVSPLSINFLGNYQVSNQIFNDFDFI